MKIILIISMFITLNATNLSQILNSLESSKKSQSIREKSKSDIAQNELDGAYAPPSFEASLSHADAIAAGEKDGLEYALGISQEIDNPFDRDTKNLGIKEYNKAIRQETKHELHLLELNIISKYHTACVSKEMQEKSALLYKEQSDRFSQIQRAYELGEISRKDLLFNKLDLAKLQQNVSSYKRVYLSEVSQLQGLSDSLVITEIDCNDLVQPAREIKIRAIEEHGELKAIEYKKNASKALYNLHSSSISSLEYGLGYEKELDMRRYTLGLSIPLGALSSQKEMLKAQQYALTSSYAFEKDALQSEIQSYSKIAQNTLATLYDEFTLLENEILPLNEDLVRLSKSALLEGEGDIMEYLDASRSYSLNVIEMLEIKKTYYTELFELYKKADMEHGEQK